MATPSVEDAGVLSPDGTKLAFVSSADGFKANVWVKDLTSGESTKVTGTTTVVGGPLSPDGYFQPSWSPSGEWLALSSDRNTAWIGNRGGAQNTQELSIYVIRPDGTDFRQVSTRPGYAQGSPKWSPDG